MRRVRPSLAVRVRALWLVAALLIVLAIAAFAAFANAPQLRVRSVDVRLPAGAPIGRDEVLKAAAIPADANIVLLGAGAIAHRIEALPYVGDVGVHRTLIPQPTVRLEVGMRTPYACTMGSGGAVTIDATARVLQAGCASAALPIVDLGGAAAPSAGARFDDPAVTQLLADLAILQPQLALRTLRRDAFGGIEAIDRSGVLLRLGEDRDLAAKLALVEPIRRAAQHGRPLLAIDLRAPATPVVTYP